MVKMLVSPNGGSMGEASVRPTKRSQRVDVGVFMRFIFFT